MRKNRAFTMIELVIVIVALGILATYTVPRLQRDNRVEAMHYMLNMIRYTQNLALHDNKHNPNNKQWQKAYWRFEIKHCDDNTDIYFRVGTDIDYSGPELSLNEVALDPANSKPLYAAGFIDCSYSENQTNGFSPNVFLKHKFGIKEVDFKSCGVYTDDADKTSTVRYVAFDSFGRPHRGIAGKNGVATSGTQIPNHFGYQLSKACAIEVSFEDDNLDPFTIRIARETGYAFIDEDGFRRF